MSFKPKVKKAQRKARARRAAKGKPPVVAQAVKPHVYPQHENAQLHSTSAHIANEARGLERLMERKRWSAA